MNLDRLLELGFERTDDTPTATEVRPLDRRAVLVTTGRPAMGTLVSVSALGRSQNRVEEAIGRAFLEMDRLIAVFSRFESGSPVSLLNAAGRLHGPPPELVHVVTRALRYHGHTGGAFDITVAPLVDLFRERFAGPPPHPAVPSDADIGEAWARVGAAHVSVSSREIRLARPAMAVTLDGIAKGYIADAMARVLVRSGVRHFLINAGGDIRAEGHGPQGKPWAVGVHDPITPGRFCDVISLDRGAVATSGGYLICFDPERRFHHIVDPATGRSPNRNASASVWAPTAMAADALATAAFVLAPDRAVAIVDALPACECLILDHQGHQWRSPGWRSMEGR